MPTPSATLGASLSIQIGFVPVDAFILDDATRGKLDQTTYVLGGNLTLQDVSAYATETISIRRGRSRSIDKFQTGTATFVLRNENRYFDPTNSSSPYYPGVVPRAPVVISLAGHVIFTGWVDDIKIDYQLGEISTATITAIDNLGLLAAAILQKQTFIEETFLGRLGHVLLSPDVMLPGGSTLIGPFTAQASAELAAETIAQTTALDHLSICCDSSDVWLFCDRNNLLTAMSANNTLNGTPIVFNDNGTSGAIRYQAVSMQSASVLLYTQIAGSGYTGNQIYVNSSNVSTYYFKGLIITTNLVNDSDVYALLDVLIARYEAPETRFDSVTVALEACTSAQQTALVENDLTCLATITRHPPGGGTITLNQRVEGIAWDLNASAGTYRCTMNFGIQYS